MEKTHIPNQKDLVYKNGFFVEKPFWTLNKIFVIAIATVALSCTYKPNDPAVGVVRAIPVVPEKTLADKIVDYVSKYNPALLAADARDIAEATVKWSEHFHIDPLLILAVQQVESGFNKFSISSGGALGVMQTIPSWHLAKLKVATKELGSPELFDPNVNIYVGSWILRDCFKQFKNQVNSLRCYNGSNAVPNGYEDKVQSSMRSINNFLKV